LTDLKMFLGHQDVQFVVIGGAWFERFSGPKKDDFKKRLDNAFAFLKEKKKHTY
jgi:hypothetical protein